MNQIDLYDRYSPRSLRRPRPREVQATATLPASIRRKLLSLVVSKGGLEPPVQKEPDSSPARLPIPPPAQSRNIGPSINKKAIQVSDRRRQCPEFQRVLRSDTSNQECPALGKL